MKHITEAERLGMFIEMLQKAAAPDSGLSDYQVRFMVRVLDYRLPTEADIKRTHKLARQLGWQKAINSATWAQ